MEKLYCILITLLPAFTIAQPKDISGVWKLKEIKSLSGPNYYNGVPRILKVQQSDSITELEITSSVNNKDTIEFERLKHGTKQLNESKTLSGRKKIVLFNWDETQGEWIKQSNLSFKNDSDRQEIEVNESYILSGQGGELVLVKNYKGNNSSGGNQNYIMQGLYKKTSEEELARETATGNGIKFEQELTWDQILKKAKKENKYIFVDCYATWCGPCKEMDKSVYNLNIVGETMNEKYISLKVQMDTGKNDNQSIKLSYSLARRFEKEYNIKSLPTYLFFDQNGKILHKDVGAYKPDEFIKLVTNAGDSAQQLYTLIDKSRIGQLQYSEMAALASRLLDMNEMELSKEVARNYLINYLYSLDDKAFLTKENLGFLRRFVRVVTSKDKYFRIFLDEPVTVDTVFGSAGFAKAIVESVINAEEIYPLMVKAYEKDRAPNWYVMEKNVTRRFGKEYAQSLLINSKVSWFKYKKEWEAYCTQLEKQIDLKGDVSKIPWLTLNLVAWDMFLYSSDKKKLEKALYWARYAIKNQMNDITLQKDKVPWTDFLDTYANLLYKLGRTKEALTYYKEKVLNVAPESKLYKDTFSKMKKNIPTWIIDESNR